MTETRALGYVKVTDPDPIASWYPSIEITDWHGETISSRAAIGSRWSVRGSYLGSHQHQIYATIDGIEYTGRSWGEGMSWIGKETSESKRMRAS